MEPKLAPAFLVEIEPVLVPVGEEFRRQVVDEALDSDP